MAVQNKRNYTVYYFFIDMRYICIILEGLSGASATRQKRAKVMSTDRLMRTARAAGFAMACDDGSAPAAAKPAAAANVQAATTERSTSLALTPARRVQHTVSNWALPGWMFWKTA